MDAIVAIRTRRAIRAYEPRDVTREVVEAVILDAAEAPPPFSGQVPWTFYVYEGRERIAEFGRRAKQFAREHRPDGAGWAWTENPDFDIFWGAPILIVIAGRVEDCCRAGQNLMLSAHARGLGTCWVGSPMLWLTDPDVKSELGIAADHQPVSAICLGYPTTIPAPPPRTRPLIVWAAP